MTQSWIEIELQEQWALSSAEVALLPGMTDKGRLGFAAQLKFMQIYGRFPERCEEIDANVTPWLGAQLGTSVDTLSDYEFDGRQGRRHRQTIRQLLGFRPATGNDLRVLSQWLNEEVLPFDPQARHGRDFAVDWFRTQRIEPPAMDHLQRIIRSAVHGFEASLHDKIHARLSDASQTAIDRLLATEEPDTTDSTDSNDSKNTETDSTESVSFSDLKSDPGKPGLESLLASIAKVQCIDRLALSAAVFEGVPTKFIEQFRARCASESIRELRRHPPVNRYSMVAMFCWRRRQQLTDLLLDLLLQVTHHLGTRAEKKIDQRHFTQFKKVRGKAQLLFKLAETTMDQPDGIIKDVVYPVVSQKTLQDIVAEFKAMGFNFDREVQERMRSSYGHHYRRMLMPVLDTVRFRSNNTRHPPVIEALEVLKANGGATHRYYEASDVPLEGVIPRKWRALIVEKSPQGTERVNRVSYELCVLRAVRKRLRTKELWAEGADRYRNPDEDLPTDFDAKRETYYDLLQAPKSAGEFIEKIQTAMRHWLEKLNAGIPTNPKVRLREKGQRRIAVTPLDKQPEPPNTAALKREIGRR